MSRFFAVVLAVLVLGASCRPDDSPSKAPPEDWQRSAAQVVFAVLDFEDGVMDAIETWRLASIDSCEELAFDSPCAMKLPERAIVAEKVTALEAFVEAEFKALARTAPTGEARRLAERAAADRERAVAELPDFLSPNSHYFGLSETARESSAALLRWGR